MASPELISYIASQQAAGVSREEIVAALQQAGYAEADIQSALPIVPPPLEASAPISFPASQPSTPNTAASSISKPTRKGRKVYFILMGIVLLMIISSIGGYVYYKRMPIVVLGETLEKVKTINAVKYRIVTEVQVDYSVMLEGIYQGTSPLSSTKINGSLDIEGGIDNKDKKKPYSAYKARMSGELGEGEKVDLGFEARMIGDIIYAQLLDSTPFLLFDLSSIENIWVKVDLLELEKKYPIGKNKETLSEQIEKNKKNAEKLEELTKKHTIVSVEKELPSEELDGASMHVYKIGVDKEALKAFWKEAYPLVVDEKLTTFEINDSVEQINMLNFKDIMLWIGKNDRFIHKLQGDIITVGTKKIPEVKLHLSGYFFEHNKSIPVDEPKEYRTLDEVMASYTKELEKKQQEYQESYQSSYPYPAYPSVTPAPVFTTAPTVLGTKTKENNGSKKGNVDLLHSSTNSGDQIWALLFVPLYVGIITK